jgi:hypothetical protein
MPTMGNSQTGFQIQLLGAGRPHCDPDRRGPSNPVARSPAKSRWSGPLVIGEDLMCFNLETKCLTHSNGVIGLKKGAGGAASRN